MKLYPLFASLGGRPVLVVGGGEVAERKVEALLSAGAAVRVGAPVLNLRLAQWVAAGRIRHLAGGFAESWLDDVFLVIAATNKTGLNRRVAAAAEQRRLLVNVVDDAELCTFHVPAIVDRSPLMIAISSAGAAPVIARRVRERLESLLDPSLGRLVALADRYRRRIRGRYQHMPSRHRFYNWLLDGSVSRLLRAGKPQDAEQALVAALNASDADDTAGHVTLVGAGPGDPGLLTLKGLRALNEADVIVHDRLVTQAVLDLSRRDATRIDVGKRTGDNHAAAQRRINDLMRTHACSGRRVVRLKGGDPFVFGRGGEELEFLHHHGIAYEVVPGISAAFGCAARAGVPLTHREHAQSVHLITIGCHGELSEQDWTALARQRQTLAIYMGVAKLALLTRQLLAHGRAPSTPFALIEKGTMPDQRVVTGTLQQLPSLARQNDVRPPAMLILGEVAALAPALAWAGQQGGTDRLVQAEARSDHMNGFWTSA